VPYQRPDEDDGTSQGINQPRSRAASGALKAGFRAYQVVALKSDGTVWAWGSNESGQLGTGGGWTSTPVAVSGLSGVSAIAADAYSLA
jgi:alpha-tubulin suppressor-like RCC1 family protein